MKDKLTILYHTNLTGNPNAGPTYSVPRQIKAQSRIDDIFWINTIDVRVDEWEKTGLYHTAGELGFRTLDDLKPPFNRPDIVVFQSFYQLKDVQLAKELKKKKIPYVIVPRGALTAEAQQISQQKKRVGNVLLFRPFAQHAAGIQYLTEKERTDSGCHWNENSSVIPNGVTMPETKRKSFSEDKIVFTFIGRIAIRHKGLDLLLGAIEPAADELRRRHCVFNLYGPDDSGSTQELLTAIQEKNLHDLIHMYPGVHGKEKEEVLLSTDVFVLTSRFEGHPMGLIEAMSYGIPVLVTTGSNMREEIEDFQAGWTAYCDCSSIQNAMEQAIRSQNCYKSCSGQARALAEKYQWNELAAKTHKWLVLLTDKKEAELSGANETDTEMDKT